MPPFSSQAYWDNRFINDSSIFDWLVPAGVLQNVAQEVASRSVGVDAEVLHIGCGTSDWVGLRDLVRSPRQMLNLDFSLPAVSASAAREKKALEMERDRIAAEGKEPPQDKAQICMRWACLDVLELESVYSLLEQQARSGKLFDLVLDKSTSDSISCGSNTQILLPYPLSINGWTRSILQTGIRHTAHIHPMHILAVHLAALTTPRTGRWVVISYSEDRLPFFAPYPVSLEHGLLTQSVIQAGFPHPNQLWQLEKKEQIDLAANHEETLAERKRRLTTDGSQRQQVKHWLYVLVRTDVIIAD